jgi:hypothetical protein
MLPTVLPASLSTAHVHDAPAHCCGTPAQRNHNAVSKRVVARLVQSGDRKYQLQAAVRALTAGSVSVSGRWSLRDHDSLEG